MPDTNISMLQTVAEGLKELNKEVVFVGGAVAQLYANDPAATEVRATLDVDCVIELSSRKAYNELEEELRSKGFLNDTTQGAPICRWIYQSIVVDVMPTDPDIIGFSNRWYVEGIENKIRKDLPNGSYIYVFSPEYYLASKFEAHKSRGGNDLRQSRDFEDIVYILDNCIDVIDNIQNANNGVQTYLKDECLSLLAKYNLLEGIASALPLDADSDRVEYIRDLLMAIASI